MKYTTKRVKVDEVSDVNISLITSLKSGEMDISLSFDKDLKPIGVESNNVVIPISSEQRRYNLKYKVTSQREWTLLY